MSTTSRTFAMSTTTIGALILRDRPPGALIVARPWLSSCAYCRRVLDEEHRTSLVFDHVIPRDASGFSSLPHNVVVSCQSCNIIKADGSIEEVFGPAAVAEVRRRAAIYIGRRGGPMARALRRVGRELGDHLYPWAAGYRAAEAERSLARYHARRASAIRDGIGGAFPFDALQEKGCNLQRSA